MPGRHVRSHDGPVDERVLWAVFSRVFWSYPRPHDIELFGGLRSRLLLSGRLYIVSSFQVPHWLILP